MSTDQFEAWAIIELFGHQRCAGRICEQAIGRETFIRVDIPRADGFYTRLFGGGAIYAINICEESTARNYAGRMAEPLAPYVALRAPSAALEDATELAGRYGAEPGAGPRADRDDGLDGFDEE